MVLCLYLKVVKKVSVFVHYIHSFRLFPFTLNFLLNVGIFKIEIENIQRQASPPLSEYDGWYRIKKHNIAMESYFGVKTYYFVIQVFA